MNIWSIANQCLHFQKENLSLMRVRKIWVLVRFRVMITDQCCWKFSVALSFTMAMIDSTCVALRAAKWTITRKSPVRSYHTIQCQKYLIVPVLNLSHCPTLRFSSFSSPLNLFLVNLDLTS